MKYKNYILIIVMIVSCSEVGNDKKQSLKASNVSIMDSKDTDLQHLDTSFRNFIFEFGYRQTFQNKSVKYPIPYDSLDFTFIKDAQTWSYDKLFIDEEAIGILSNESLIANTVNEYVFSWVYPEKKRIKNYYFHKQENKWLLTKVELKELYDTQSQEDLYVFLNKICNDSLFQKSRIKFPMEVVRLDKNDRELQEKITANNWKRLGFYYRCDSLPILRKNTEIGENVSITMRGVENGIFAVFKVKMLGNKWYLVGYKDIST